MKIISIGLYNPLPINSGVDSYISYLLNPLGKKNDVVHYYFFRSENEKGYYPNEINFRTEYLKSESLETFQGLPRVLQLVRPELLIDKRPLKNITADMVLCDAITFHAGRYISKINKCPLILIKHNIEWKYLQGNGSRAYLFLKAYEHYTLPKANAIITISMNDYKYISEYVDEDRIYYLPSKVNTEIFNPGGNSYKFGDDKFNLLFYGSLDREMNIDAVKFIKNRLVPLLQKEHLMNRVRINIFGSGSPPKYLNLEQDRNINYLGTVENPGEYIRGTDLVIVPLKNSGGMKIRLLETLFCEIPAVATSEAVSGLSDELKKMVYVEDNAKGFVRTIKKVMSDGEKNKIDMQLVESYMGGTTMQEVITEVDSLIQRKDERFLKGSITEVE